MVVKLYQPAATCSPSVKADSYIYSIVPTSSNGLAAITSADELVLLDRATLQKVSAFNGVPTGVTCLQQGDKGGHILLCSGRDGSVASFDVRSKAMVSQFKLGKKRLLYAHSFTPFRIRSSMRAAKSYTWMSSTSASSPLSLSCFIKKTNRAQIEQ